MTVAVVVGSSFSEGFSEALGLVAEQVDTRHGRATLHRSPRGSWVLFRHGVPHRLLPQHINWRANAQALKQVGVSSLLVTSSVGVLDGALPLYRPLLVADLLMLENRLPDGTLCTLFTEPASDHGHLVLGGQRAEKALAKKSGNVVEVGRPLQVDHAHARLRPQGLHSRAGPRRTQQVDPRRQVLRVGQYAHNVAILPAIPVPGAIQAIDHNQQLGLVWQAAVLFVKGAQEKARELAKLCGPEAIDLAT